MRFIQVVTVCFFTQFLIAQNITIVCDSKSPRIQFGAQKLGEVLSDKGFRVSYAENSSKNKTAETIVIGEKGKSYSKNLSTEESNILIGKKL